jgi:nucleoid DNA-binding protein
MQDLITSFIIQSKECKLSDIGKFTVVTRPAKADIANKQITPPFREIVFNKREEKITDELVKYVADKKGISSFEAFSEIKKWCAETKEKLKNGEEILLDSLGVLKKESSGNISFENQITSPFFAPVPAERVIHKNSEHAVLVGDRETTSSVMNQFYSEEETTTKSNAWKIIAIILLAIALVLLFFYFYSHPFSLSELGNHVKTVPQSSPATYLNK